MGLDQTALDELRALDPDGSSGILPQIINSYLSDAPALIQGMRAALAAKDMTTLARNAHSLKSTSLSLGATRVSEIAREMEVAGKSLAIETCPMLLMALTAEYAAAERLLQAECAAAAKARY